MKEVISQIDRWRAAGLKVATARVVGVEGSGPRDPGATMVVNERGDVAGSVSGGCVEGAVVTEALQALESGRVRLCTFGYSDGEAFAVGLTCGGTVHVLVDPSLPSVYEELRDAIASERSVALCTVAEIDTDVHAAPLGACMLVFEDGKTSGTLGSAQIESVVRRDALGALSSGLSATRHYGEHGEARRRDVSVFIEVFAPPPRMVIFGAVDFTAALARVAKVLGYHVEVCDARPVFATPARFPMADEVIVSRPERYLARIGSSLGPRDAVCVLTHDPKFDVPAIMAAVETRAGYIGAMGSRRTNEDRLARLHEAGADDHALERVMAPIGLDIGARTPEETAVSICAEIIALRTGQHAPSLRDGIGAIHVTDPAVQSWGQRDEVSTGGTPGHATG